MRMATIYYLKLPYIALETGTPAVFCPQLVTALNTQEAGDSSFGAFMHLFNFEVHA